MAIKVKGLSVQDIIDTYSIKDLAEVVNGKEKISTSDIKALTTRLVSATNKRLKRIAEAGITTPTVESHTQAGISATTKSGVEYNKLSTKGKSRAQLIATFEDARKLLTLQTASVRGAKKFIQEEYKSRTGIDLSKFNIQQQRNYWRLVNRVKELKSAMRKNYSTNEIIEMVEIFINDPNNAGKDYDTLERELLEQLERGYVRAQETQIHDTTEFTIES